MRTATIVPRNRQIDNWKGPGYFYMGLDTGWIYFATQEQGPTTRLIRFPFVILTGPRAGEIVDYAYAMKGKGVALIEDSTITFTSE